LTFPNATYHTSKAQWDTFKNPNAIEKASMLKENLQPIEDSGQLRLIRDDVQLTANIRLRLFSGHTKGQVIPFINYKGKTLVYVADLLPTMGNIPMAWITAYDVEPLVVFEEKKRFLDEALKNEYVLFFEHDYYNECCTLKLTPKGIRVDKKFNLEELKVS
jgi:glyoxylase-like metal-dependent hydrolase (beta-lactamase superfamily II)